MLSLMKGPELQDPGNNLRFENTGHAFDWDSCWEMIYYDFFRPDFYYHGFVIIFFMTFNVEWTINYPNEKPPQSSIFRGEHALRRYFLYSF